MMADATLYPDAGAAAQADADRPWRVASFDAATIEFIETRAFFVLATANERGESDCSYRGRELRPDGSAQPLLQVLDQSSLVFPHFSGNNLFNSIGNLLRNPPLSLLFVDFEHGAGTVILGGGRVERADPATWGKVWSEAHAVVRVDVKEVLAGRWPSLPKLTAASAGR